MSNLSDKRCMACEGGTPPLSRVEAEKLLAEVSSGWTFEDDAKKIREQFVFKNFKEALSFVNKVADIAEEEQHHPDIRIFSYKKVEIELSTHAVGGLSENDFILAAKIDKIS